MAQQFNCMEADHDSEANTYDTGPGRRLSREHQPGNHRLSGTKNQLKLHVKNIPEDLSTEALENIFAKYGVVKECFISANRHFGGVTFAEESSAHRALINLNNDSTFHFKVGYFMEKEKPAFDNDMQKRYQHQLVTRNEEFNTGNHSSANGHRTPQFTNVPNENHSFHQRRYSRSITGDHMNSAMSSPGRLTTSGPAEVKLMPMPQCRNKGCLKTTLEYCKKCMQSYCSKKCMVLGYEYHTDVCITIAPHSLDPPMEENEESITRVNAGPSKNVSRLNQLNEFKLNAEDYRRHQTPNLADQVESLRISNSYDNDDETNPNSRYNDNDSVAQKSHAIAAEDVGDGASRRTDNFRNHNDSLTSEDRDRNQVPKTNTRVRNGNETQNRTKYSENRPRNDRPFDSPAPRRNDDSRSDDSRPRRSNDANNSNRSDESRQRRNYDANNSNQGDSYRANSSKGRSNGTDTSKYGSRGQSKKEDENAEYRPKKSTGRGDSRTPTDDLEQISFSQSLPQSGDRKKYTDESNKKPDNRGRSTNDTASETRDYNQQANNEPREYENSRKTYREGDKLEVRLNEITTDMPEYSSVKIVEEEHLLPKMSADIMKEMDLPRVTVKAMTKCLVCLDHERVRAMIVSEKPLKVKYIDRSYKVHSCEEERIRGLPEKYAVTRPFAYKVKILNAQDKDLESLVKDQKIFEIVIKKKVRELLWEVEILASDYSERLEEARQSRAVRNSQTPNNVKNGLLFKPLEFKPGLRVEVLVTFIEKDRKTFYVSRIGDVEKMQELVTKHAKDCTSLEEIEKDMSCLALEVDNQWYRAKIIETNPLEVRFIDFGNTEKVDKKNLKNSSMVCAGYEPLAIRVKLAEGVTSEYGIEQYESHILRVIATDVSEKLWTVVSDKYLKVTILYKVSESELYVVKESDKGTMEKISELPFVPLKSQPKVGSTYLVPCEGLNCRAQLLSASPLTVKYIDYGNNAEIGLEDLGELPAEWQKRDPLAFKICVSPKCSGSPLEEYSMISIKEDEDKKWIVIR